MPKSIFGGKPWSPEEDAIIREHYPHIAMRCAGLLPGRTKNAVRIHANKLGIHNRVPWTEAEEARLVDLFGAKSLLELSKILGRDEYAISRKALELGLRADRVRQGYITMTAAAEKYGVSGLVIGRVVRWARLHAHHLPVYADARPSKRKRVQYDASDMDEAVEDYTSSETASEAARRLGVSDQTIKKWLSHAGIQSRQLPGKRTHCRFKKEDVDRVFWAHQNAERVTYAANRVGVPLVAFRRAVARSGAPKTGRLWLIDPELADRIAAEWHAKRSSKTAA